MSVLKTTSRCLGLVWSGYTVAFYVLHCFTQCLENSFLFVYTLSLTIVGLSGTITKNNIVKQFYLHHLRLHSHSLQINVTFPYSSFISSIHTVVCVAIKLDLRQHFTMLQVQRQGVFQVVTCGATNCSFQMPDSLCFR